MTQTPTPHPFSVLGYLPGATTPTFAAYSPTLKTARGDREVYRGWRPEITVWVIRDNATGETVADTPGAPIWSRDLRDASAALATTHRNPDIASRAREIYHGAKLGQTLTDMNIDFITSMRSRFGDVWGDSPGDRASKVAESAFQNAWGAAWDAANPRP